MKNQIIKVILSVLAGAVIGALSKWSDVSGNSLGYSFGWLSSGVVLWLNVGVLFLVTAGSRKEFNLLYARSWRPCCCRITCFRRLSCGIFP